MSTETQVQDQQIEDLQEIEQDVQEGAGAEGGEGGQEGKPEAEKPFQAWEDLPKPEPKIPAHIPYDRFKQVNEERAQFFEDNKALGGKIKELEAQIAKLQAVPDPEDLDPDDFPTVKEYLAARDRASAVKIRADLKQELAQEEQQRLQEQQAQAVAQQYASNLERHTAEDPNVPRAKDFFDTYASMIDPEVGRELLSDPNVGHVMVRLATNKELLAKFFQSTPDQAIRLINRVSERIDAERELKPKVAEGDGAGAQAVAAPPRRPVPAPLQVQTDPRAKILAALPTQIRTPAAPPGVDLYKDAEKMTMAQYRRARGM